MTKQSRLDIPVLRATLLRQREELSRAEKTGDEAAATVELDQTRMGRLSRMDAMQAQAMSVETNRRRELRLKQIDATLLRIEDDDYGICTQCDEAIATGRIEYDPTVKLCIECASKAEK